MLVLAIVPVIKDDAVRFPTTVEVLVTVPVRSAGACSDPTTVEVEAMVPEMFAGVTEETDTIAATVNQFPLVWVMVGAWAEDVHDGL